MIKIALFFDFCKKANPFLLAFKNSFHRAKGHCVIQLAIFFREGGTVIPIMSKA